MPNNKVQKIIFWQYMSAIIFFNILLVDIRLNLEIKCSKNVKATHYFDQSSKTPTINKSITFEHIQVPRAKGIDQIKSPCYLVVCQLSRDVIGYEGNGAFQSVYCPSIVLLGKNVAP